MDHYHGREQGSITIIALIILIVLTIIGLSISTTSTTDIRIAANELLRKQDFYMAEGGVNREAQEVGSGNYAVMDVNTPATLATHSSAGLPPPTPHTVTGQAYNFTLQYIGFNIPPKGYSATDFSRYDYDIDAQLNNVGIRARYYQIGPKAN